MAPLLTGIPYQIAPNCGCFRYSQVDVGSFSVRLFTARDLIHRRIKLSPRVHPARSAFRRFVSQGNLESTEEEDFEPIEALRIPEHWLHPQKALEESEWLRNTLRKWLDDEYCPEETNIKISEVAAHSFYKSLMERKTDIGEILLTMARELESISYQESFHGAFSSANAAADLIIQRLEQN